MADDDWHRRTTWTAEDQEAFFGRLKRCRSESTRTQALRIQAGVLADAGMPAEGVALLDQLLAEHPDDYFRGQTHAERADCHRRLGDVDAAIADYRAALALEHGDCPNVHTNAWLDLPWLIVESGRVELFDEVLATLDRGSDDDTLTFPATIYVCEAVRAVIAAERGEGEQARRHAAAALAAASQGHSGLPRHADAGLVGTHLTDTDTHRRIERLARGDT